MYVYLYIYIYMSVGQPIPLPPPPPGNGPPAPPLWCGVGGGIPPDFHLKSMCLHTMSCHAMAFHMLRNMMLFMRALQHLIFFMQSCVLSCTLFHLTLIEFICIFIGFNMSHETPRPPPCGIVWGGKLH